MACKIPYLDNNYQGEQLKELRNKHISIVKDIISSKLFYRRDNKLQLSMDLNSNIRKQQEEYVNNIPELSIVTNNNKDILSLKVDKELESNIKYNYTTRTNSVDTNIESYFNNGKTTVGEILDKIKNPDLKILVDYIKQYATNKQKNISVNLIDNAVNRGMYFNNNIYINKNALFPKGSAEKTILHEILHPLTLDFLNNNKQSDLYKDFDKLYNHVKSKLLVENKPYYGLSNIEEFITESFTNAEFISEMMQMESISGIGNYKNLFEQFVDAVAKVLKRLFNIKDDNLYNQVAAVASNIIAENTDTDYDAGRLETFMEERVYYDVDSQTVRDNSEYSEFLNNPDNEAKFVKMIGDIKNKFQDYIQLLSDSIVDYPSSEKEIKIKELNILKSMLDNSTTEDAIIGLNNYIVQSTQWIDIIYKEYFEQQNNVLSAVKNLSNLNEEDKEKEIQRLTKVLNKSKHFLYLFQDLEDFKNELQRDGFVPSDKYNTKFLTNKDLFTTELAKLSTDLDVEVLHAKLVNDNLSTEQFKELIVTQYLQVKDNLLYSDVNDFTQALHKMFDDNINNTFTSQMSEALNKASKLKSEIKNLHYKLTTEWLYPEFNKAQIGNYKPDDPRFITKQRFEALLKIADRDENFISSWLEATIQSKDPLVATVAKKISNAMAIIHQNNIVIGDNISSNRKVAGFDEMKGSERKEAYNEMINLIDELVEDDYGNPIELTEDDVRDSVSINTLTGIKRYLIKKVKAFKTGKHTSLVEAKRKLVNNLLYRNKKDEPSLINEIINRVVNDEDEITPEVLYDFLVKNNKKIPELYDVALSLFETTVDGKLKSNKKFNNKVNQNSIKELKQSIKNISDNILWRKLFYEKTYVNKSATELNKLLLDNNIDVNNLTKDNVEYLLDNSSDNSDIDKFKYLTNNKYTDGLVTISDNNGLLKFMYKDALGKLRFDELSNIPNNIQAFYYKKNDFVDLKDEYKLEEYKGKYKDYFDLLYNTFQEHNKKLGNKRLKHGKVPQVELTGLGLSEVTLDTPGDFFKSIMDWFVNAFNTIKKAWNELNDSVLDNEEEKSTFESEYLNGDKVKQVGISFTKSLENQDKVEWDLSVSTAIYSFMVNKHQVLKDYDAQMQVVRTLVTGDTLLGIETRKAKKTDSLNRIVKRKRRGKSDEDNFKRDVANNLNAKLTEFIDEMMYDEADYLAFDLKGLITSKGIESKLSNYTSFTSLALNVLGMTSNILNGKVATYLESVQGKYFDIKTWRESEAEYWKNAAYNFKDFMSNNMQDKSKVGQMLIILDAIQGEYLESFEETLKYKKLSDMPKTALYFTQNGAEHWIQTVNMIAMLKAEGLWDEINYKEGELITFTAEQVERLNKLQGKLHAVNKRLNGAYAKIDKSRLQRRWFGRLILMFRKYIWQSFKARLGDERLDIESGDVVRGYVKSYYSELLKDLKSNKSFAYKALKVGKQIGQDNRRLVLGLINTATFGQFNKNINVNKVYGFENMDETQIQEAKRYIAEMSLFVSFTLLGALLGSVDDDDDNEMLQTLELISRRQRSDMGTFLPTMVAVPTLDAGAFNTFDFIKRTVSSPVPAMRSVDNSISALSQLLSVEIDDSEGINFTANDVYTKSGEGYEAGDLKLTRKLEKSVVAPYWQLLKLANPQAQLQYLEMVNKNSR